MSFTDKLNFLLGWMVISPFLFGAFVQFLDKKYNGIGWYEFVAKLFFKNKVDKPLRDQFVWIAGLQPAFSILVAIIVVMFI